MPDRIAELRALEAAATPGEWFAGEDGTICGPEQRGMVGVLRMDHNGDLVPDIQETMEDPRIGMMNPCDGYLAAALRNTFARLLAVAEAAQRLTRAMPQGSAGGQTYTTTERGAALDALNAALDALTEGATDDRPKGTPND